MSSNYKAFAVTASGRYEIVSRPVPTPGSGQVLVRVLACGICRMDLELFQGTLPAGIYPRVPGHEVIGIIESLGPDVGGWRVGQQVGCGFFGGQCGVCAACRMGNFIHCHTLIQTGVTRDGGFAEVMLAETRALLLVPQDTPATILAPLFSAGVNVYCALRSGVARPGEIVAVHGLDGIGKLGLQFASKMGLQTLSIANGKHHAATALRFGAHAFIDTQRQNATDVLLSIGGAQAILTTLSDALMAGELIRGLAPRGTLVLLDSPSASLSLSGRDLSRVSGRILSESSGTPFQIEETLRFALPNKIVPECHVISLEETPTALRQIGNGDGSHYVVSMQADKRVGSAMTLSVQ